MGTSEERRLIDQAVTAGSTARRSSRCSTSTAATWPRPISIWPACRINMVRARALLQRASTGGRSVAADVRKVLEMCEQVIAVGADSPSWTELRMSAERRLAGEANP